MDPLKSDSPIPKIIEIIQNGDLEAFGTFFCPKSPPIPTQNGEGVKEIDVLNLVDADGRNVTHWAAACDRAEILQIVLENVKNRVESGEITSSAAAFAADEDGWTCLHVATATNSRKCLTMLIQFIDDDVTMIPLLTPKSASASSSSSKAVHPLFQMNSAGNTLLHIASARGYLEGLRALVECEKRLRDRVPNMRNPALVNTMNKMSQTPLWLAVSRTSTASARYLMESANANPSLTSKLDDNDTILHVAVENGDSEMVALIMEIAPYLADVKNDRGINCSENSLVSRWL